jgi:hypothetical protein
LFWMWQVTIAVFWSWCVAQFVVVVATSFVWFVWAWKRGGDLWNFFLFGTWQVGLSTWCYFFVVCSLLTI